MFPGVSFLCKDKFRAFEDHPRRLWGPPAIRRIFRGAICSPLPAKPCGTVPGSKIFTEIPRRRLPSAALPAARFAPRPPLALAAPFRGAKSSHISRAAACLRRPFPRRDLLPTPRKALRHRPGEQNLHRNLAPPLGAACNPPDFPRRDLLPAPRKALRLRFGEQNLHRDSAPLPISTIPRCKELTTKALSSIFRRQF